MDAHCTVTARAVLFDLDGVLVDSTAAVEGHWREFAARNRLDPVALLEDLHGRRMVDIIARALPHHTAEDLAREADWMEDTEARGAQTGTKPQPGALELVDAVDGRPWAIVTSGTEPVATARIAAVGLPLPAVLVTGEQVEHGKPDPAPYLVAAERLGIPAPECLVIEDAPAGLAAGRAAGATTVALTTSHPYAEMADADHVVASPAEVHVLEGDEVVLALDCLTHRQG